MPSFDVIILGAGAAGLMAAIEAGRRGRSVLLLEKSAKPAEKIRISGGGRCNFTNLRCAPANFLSNNPRFCVSALKRYTQHDFLARVEAAGIAWHEKTLGQLFCDGSSQQIIDLLLGDAGAAGVELRTGVELSQVARHGAGFRVAASSGVYEGTSLVVATGGPSIPKMGATGYAYDLARQFGLKIVEPRPALVPFTFDPLVLEKLKPLSGVSAEAEVSCSRTRFREALLFTHRGLSGPAVLQISSYWRPGEAISIDLLPGRNAFAELRQARSESPKQELLTWFSERLPRRLAQLLSTEAACGTPRRPFRQEAACHGGAAARLAPEAGRHRGLPHSGGYRRRRRHRRDLLQDLRGREGPRTLLHRRVPRRHRLARRLQFPVGLVLRPRGRAVRVSRGYSPVPPQ